MHRNLLLSSLRSYDPSDAHESAMRTEIIRFVESEPRCFDRSTAKGHITGSAFIVNHDRTHTLLTHHHMLDKWLQLGGHADGDPDVLAVALREAHEESGLRHIVPITNDIFDVDVHPIPQKRNVPEHLHYDVRYLLEADMTGELLISPESKDLAWILLEKVGERTSEESIMRMVKKALLLKR